MNKLVRIIGLLIIILLSAVVVYGEECDYEIEILMNESSYTPEDFTFKLRTLKVSGESTTFTGIASIEDENGNLIKEYRPWTDQSIATRRTSTTYTPNLDTGKYTLYTSINVQCDDSDSSNNEVNQPFEIVLSGGTTTTVVDDTTTTTLETTTTTLPDETTTTTMDPTSTTLEDTTTTTLETTTTIPESTTTTVDPTSTTVEDTTTTIPESTTTTVKGESLFSSITKALFGESGEKVEKEVIFEDSSYFSRKLALFLLIGISIIINVILIWKR